MKKVIATTALLASVATANSSLRATLDQVADTLESTLENTPGFDAVRDIYTTIRDSPAAAPIHGVIDITDDILGNLPVVGNGTLLNGTLIPDLSNLTLPILNSTLPLNLTGLVNVTQILEDLNTIGILNNTLTALNTTLTDLNLPGIGLDLGGLVNITLVTDLINTNVQVFNQLTGDLTDLLDQIATDTGVPIPPAVFDTVDLITQQYDALFQQVIDILNALSL